MTTGYNASEHRSPTGSPQPGEPVFLVIGKLRRPHGVHGEMIMDILTDFPERLKAGMTVFVGEEHKPYKAKTWREHQKGSLVSFFDFTTPETVGILRNQLVYVKTSELPALPQGEYYHHQVIGLRVVDESGAELGSVTDVIATGANDVFIVKQEGGSEFLLPAIDEMVLNIDLDKGEICARPLPGLLPE
jgi:16S rRNA processing protein RimM